MIQFSVVIPVYNKASFIKQTLDSVLSQSYRDFEVIVVDDGSTDDSIAVVEAFSDDRIRLVKQANAGVSVARNNGITHANAPWICFLDADDWYHPAYLESLVSAIDHHEGLNIFAATFLPLANSPNWNPKAWELPALDYELIENLPERWMKGIPFFTSSVAVKRETLQSMQPCFPPGESSGEDLDLWFRLAEKQPIMLLLSSLVVYRTEVEHSLSVSSKSIDKPFLQRMLARSNTLPAPLKKSSLELVNHYYCTVSRAYAHSGNRVAALVLMKNNFYIGKLVPRYWVTLIMIMLVPGTLINKWQSWKVSKSMTRLSDKQ